MALWVSVEGENDWLSWCISEQFRLNDCKHATEVVLMPGANILTLSTAEAIDAFAAEYAYRPLGPSFMSNLWCRWDRLAQKYQGIIIAPYSWERRMTEHTAWYYGWDCASGCIWDTTAIGALVPLPTLNLKRREEAA